MSTGDDLLGGCPFTETLHGWYIGWHGTYPKTVVIACQCEHLSVRERDEVEAHVCPSCGKTGAEQKR